MNKDGLNSNEILNNNKESQQEKKDTSNNTGNKKIIPSYMKNKEGNQEILNGKNHKKVKDKTVKNKRKINKKALVFIISVIVLLIALSIFIYTLLQNKKYAKYVPYEETMHTYAFDIMYDNKTAATREKVTKSEAIKMVIAATLNITEISGLPEENKFNNDIWVKQAIIDGILNEDEITVDNANDPVTYIEIVSYLEKAKNKLLNENLKTGVELQYKNADKYTTEQQTYLQDLIEMGVIENSKSKLKGNRKVFKGEVNELITKYAEKNNTITLEGDKININPDKVPSNSSEYPYILSNVDKKIYEIAFQEGEYTDYTLNPKEVYIERKEFYSDYKYMIENYYNNLLNVDYSTINAEEFFSNIDSYVFSGVNMDDVNEYVNYVKENKIKISGKAKVQMPIIYFDGVDYRVRTKLEFDLEESFVENNVLFYDLKSKEPNIYNKGENTIIVDVKLRRFLASSGLRVRLNSINEII